MRNRTAQIRHFLNAHTDAISLVLLLVLLIICNLAFVPTAGWTRLAWNLFGYIGLFGIYKFAKLSLSDIGLSAKNFRTGMKLALYVIAIIAAGFLVIFFVNGHAFKDPRYHHSIPVALYASFVILPLKTVLFEELAFRGIALSLLFRVKSSRWFATIFSSVAFGAWHVTTSVDIGNYNIGGNIIVPKALVAVAATIAPALFGIVLCELRWRSKSLVAPIAVHWFLNAFATLLAAFSWR